MREFDHIGLPTTEKQPDELYVAATKVWVTNPSSSSQMIEYLRYEPDSPVTGPLRTLPHLCFRVDDLDAEMAGAQIELGPFNPTPDVRAVFVYKEGVVWEFMESKAGKDWHKAAKG